MILYSHKSWLSGLRSCVLSLSFEVHVIKCSMLGKYKNSKNAKSANKQEICDYVKIKCKDEHISRQKHINKEKTKHAAL